MFLSYASDTQGIRMTVAWKIFTSKYLLTSHELLLKKHLAFTEGSVRAKHYSRYTLT